MHHGVKSVIRVLNSTQVITQVIWDKAEIISKNAATFNHMGTEALQQKHLDDASLLLLFSETELFFSFSFSCQSSYKE